MRSTPLQWRHALVTGASSGLGADLARELAGRGAGLVLVIEIVPDCPYDAGAKAGRTLV